MATSNTTACIVDFPYLTGGCTCPQHGWWSVAPPPPCPVHSRYAAPAFPYVPPVVAPLTEEQIEAIARRVAELLKAAP